MKSHSKIAGFVLVCALVAAIGTLVVIVDYNTAFPFSAPVDGENPRAVWGVIGDYFGGVLNPIYGFLGFIALLVTIIIQAEEMSASREEARISSSALADQVKHLKTEAIKSDLYRMIEFVHKELKESAVKGVWMPAVGEGYTLSPLILFGPDKTEKFFNLLPSKMDEKDDAVKKSISIFSEQITELALYISKYRSLGGDSSLSTYFAMRYGMYAISLYEKGYIEEKTKNSLIFP